MFNYRCTKSVKCGLRRSLHHPIDWYKYRPICKGCGKDSLSRVDLNSRDRSLKRGCFFKGNFWPHNKGRIESADRTCIHADPARVQTFEMAEALEAQRVDVMKPSDSIPF